MNDIFTIDDFEAAIDRLIETALGRGLKGSDLADVLEHIANDICEGNYDKIR